VSRKPGRTHGPIAKRPEPPKSTHEETVEDPRPATAGPGSPPFTTRPTASAIKLARLLGQRKGMNDLVGEDLPSSMTLFSATVPNQFTKG
jgi:hypothetical protein